MLYFSRFLNFQFLTKVFQFINLFIQVPSLIKLYLYLVFPMYKYHLKKMHSCYFKNFVSKFFWNHFIKLHRFLIIIKMQLLIFLIILKFFPLKILITYFMLLKFNFEHIMNYQIHLPPTICKIIRVLIHFRLVLN